MRFEAKVTRGFSLSPRRFAARSLFRVEKFQERPLGPRRIGEEIERLLTFLVSHKFLGLTQYEFLDTML